MSDKYIIRGAELQPEVAHNCSKTIDIYLLDAIQSHGNKIIAVDGITEENIDTKELVKRSFILASHLQHLKCNAGDVVGILCENSLDYIVLMLAIFHIGAIVTTFNPLYTSDELKHVINISKPKIVFVSANYLDKGQYICKEILCVEHTIVVDGGSDEVPPGVLCLSTLLKNTSYEVTSIRRSCNDIAMILYSSGTTGFPKGVALHHRGIIHFLEMSRTGEMARPLSDHTIGNVPMFHGFGVFINFLSIVLGYTLIVMKKFEQKLFLQHIEKYKVQTLYLVPPLVILLAKSPLVESYDLSSLKEIFCGAAPLSEFAIQQVMNRLNLNVYQAYGMTELSFVVVANRRYNHKKYTSIGRIFSGMCSKVVDLETGLSTERMKVGELCFSGPMLMTGYYGNEEETKRTIDSDGWLHTGDVGYVDHDGDFFILDRVKELIKYKGYQVAPAELESLLLKHEDIKDAAVVGLPDDFAGELPKAFVVRNEGSLVTEKDIIKYVADHVSPQKHLRGGVTFVNEIPRNPSGKILRKELRALLKTKL